MPNRFRLLATVASASLLAASPSFAQDAPIVQPGAPGQDSKRLNASEATQLAGSRYIQADLDFMQAMIPHHYQASQMVALVADRTNNEDVNNIARKIAAGQEDEITFMQQWLRDRGAKAPDPAAHAKMGHDVSMMHAGMAGMATPAQMAQLAAASGTEFDRLFLTLMMAHHKGALEMVDDLFDQQGAAYDPVMYRFVTDVRTDQNSEVDRMNALLEGLAEDPRTTLAAGYLDAGQAIKGLTLVGSLPKPAGFFDPENPAGMQLEAATESPVAKPVEDNKDGGKQDEASKAIAALKTAISALESATKDDN
ncbi:MAG: DUF305 domain-containing protein, partial [Sphingomonadaceae bacterium]|nr:DUF305 domain-containing protein [Sphingomonadaceae bacterium]